MTRIAYRRCIQCRDRYEYQLSGWGAPDLNHGQYCPSCYGKVVEALKDVKPKFECRYVPVAQVEHYASVTRDDIQRWQADLEERRKTNLVAQRIFSPLFDLETGDSQHSCEVIASDGPFKGLRFRYTYWHDTTPDNYSIEVPMEYDIVNDRLLGMWYDYQG